MNSTFLGDPRYAAQDWYAQCGMENFGPQTSVYFDDGTMSAYSWSGNLDSVLLC